MRLAFRKTVVVVALLAALGVVELVTIPSAEASYGFHDALETIGIAAGIGSVLGLSTIAFYEQPTAHLKNTLIGAGVGTVVGIGVAAYLMAASSESDEIDPEELLPKKKPAVPGAPGKDPLKSGKVDKTWPQRFKLGAARILASVPATLAIRDSSLSWAVAVPVLELRF